MVPDFPVCGIIILVMAQVRPVYSSSQSPRPQPLDVLAQMAEVLTQRIQRQPVGTLVKLRLDPARPADIADLLDRTPDSSRKGQGSRQVHDEGKLLADDWRYAASAPYNSLSVGGGWNRSPVVTSKSLSA